MKKILLLSDTHGYIDDRILYYAQNVDEIWHAGDIGEITVAEAFENIKPFKAVYGNIDGTTVRSAFPLHHHFEIEGIKVFMTHIAGYPGRYKSAAKEQIIAYQPDLVICGHSHILKLMPDKKLNHIHMNPGAAGKHGFHKVRTMLQFEIDAGKIKNLNVIELGTRGKLSS